MLLTLRYVIVISSVFCDYLQIVNYLWILYKSVAIMCLVCIRNAYIWEGTMRQRFRLLKSALATALCVTVLAAGFIFPVHVQAANAIRPSNVTEPGEGCKLYNYQGTFDTATKMRY